MFRITIVTIFLIFPLMSYAQEPSEKNGWDLKRDKVGIKVMTRDVAGSKFKEVRAVMTEELRLESVVALIRDAQACREWAELCKEARVVETSSETHYKVYNYNDVPWPAKDRDAVTEVVWSVDPASGTVTMTATAVDSELVPPTKKAVRLKNAVTRWILTPRPKGQLEIISEGHVDPEGPTPAWLTNIMLVDTPYRTLAGLRRQLAQDPYPEVEFDFLKAR